MDVEWIAAGASAVAALCSAGAWHAARTNGRNISTVHDQANSRESQSFDEHGRAERAIGQGEGIRNERADNAARLENVAVTGVAVTELPTQMRVTNGSE